MATIKIKNDTITPALEALARQMGDMSDVMNDIGMALVASSEKRMDDGVSPDGSAFAPRSPVTIKHYERNKISFGGVLHKSGKLRQNIFHTYGPEHVEIGTNEPYAAVMQFGAAQGQFGAFIGKDKKGRDHFHSIPWGNIPARPFLGVSQQDEIDILDILAEWAQSATNGGA